ncbi:hypothetical protein [Caulobacter sp. S45]|nr:hypothetical protein [Caulobacter sp. S45]
MHEVLAYQRAVIGGFDPYLGQFAPAEAAATGWFREHIGDPSE